MLIARRFANAAFVCALSAGGLLVATGDAAAVNLNTHAATCRAFSPSQAGDIVYTAAGVKTAAGINSSRTVICSIPRSPKNAETSQSFYVDGSNSAGQTTAVTLFAHNFNGDYQWSWEILANEPAYDRLVTLTPVSTWSYISALVTLPPNGGGTFRGVSVLQ